MLDTIETIEIVIPLEIQFPPQAVGKDDLPRTQRKYREAAHGLASVALEAINLERQRVEEARRAAELRREQERIRLERQFLRD